LIDVNDGAAIDAAVSQRPGTDRIEVFLGIHLLRAGWYD
jgi:hypothetical protein